MKLKLSLFVAAAAISASLAHAQVLSPTQTANASVDLGSSAPPFLTVNWFNGEENVGLLQFDLSGITGPVNSAELNLFQWANPDSGAQFGLFLNTSAWTPGSVGGSLSNLPTTGAEVGELDINDSNAQVWRSVDLTTIAGEWADGSVANYGLTLERLDQSNPYVYFGSTDGSVGGQPNFAPTLVINGASNSVPDESSTGILAGIAVAALLLLGRRRALFSRV